MSINIKTILSVTLLINMWSSDLHATFNNDLNPKLEQSDNNSIYNQEDLPMSLLLRLVGDAKENDKVIAGFYIKDLKEEIKNREEHQSIPIAEPQLNPVHLSSDLLLWLANQTETFGGITPNDALLEMQKRLQDVSEDEPQVATVYALNQEVEQNRSNALKRFSDRENSEEMSDLAKEAKETIRLGQNPSVNAQMKQLEKVQEQKHKISVAYEDYLQDKKYDGDAPHGYSEENQYDRTKKEVQEAKTRMNENEHEHKTWFEQVNSFFQPEEQNNSSQEIKDEKEQQKQNIMSYMLDDTTMLL